MSLSVLRPAELGLYSFWPLASGIVCHTNMWLSYLHIHKLKVTLLDGPAERVMGVHKKVFGVRATGLEP